MHTVNTATGCSLQGQQFQLSMLRDGNRFAIRVQPIGSERFADTPCKSAAEAEALYCRLLSVCTTGFDLAPIKADRLAYLAR